GETRAVRRARARTCYGGGSGLRPDAEPVNLGVAMSALGMDESAAACNVLFRCDGGPTIGMGHVARCLAVAEALCRHHSCRAEFAVARQGIAVEMIRRAGYLV